MNRRGFLKGTAALSAAPLIVGREEDRIAAQAPMYQGEVLYTFTEFAGAEYDLATDGRATGVSRNGLIVGIDRVDGKRVPCTWDLDGTRTVLDTGSLEFASWYGMAVSPGGLLAGTYLLLEDDPLQAGSVSWASGAPEALTVDGAARVVVSQINDAGMVAGLGDRVAVRWGADGAETFPGPPDAPAGYISLLSDDGGAYGTSLTEEGGAVGSPWLWNADGTVVEFGWPEDLIAENPDAISGLANTRIRFDDASFILWIYWKVGDVWTVGSWLNQDGAYTRLTSGGAPAAFGAIDALDPTRIYGTDTTPDAGGAAFLENGTLTLLETVSSLPPGNDIGSIKGLTSDGAIVASTTDSSGKPGILLLTPM